MLQPLVQVLRLHPSAGGSSLLAKSVREGGPGGAHRPTPAPATFGTPSDSPGGGRRVSAEVVVMIVAQGRGQVRSDPVEREIIAPPELWCADQRGTTHESRSSASPRSEPRRTPSARLPSRSGRRRLHLLLRARLRLIAGSPCRTGTAGPLRGRSDDRQIRRPYGTICYTSSLERQFLQRGAGTEVHCDAGCRGATLARVSAGRARRRPLRTVQDAQRCRRRNRSVTAVSAVPTSASLSIVVLMSPVAPKSLASSSRESSRSTAMF